LSEPQLPPEPESASGRSLARDVPSSPEIYHEHADNEVTQLSQNSISLRIIGRIAGILIVAGAIVLGGYVTRLYYLYPRTDDAYVRANIVGIAPHVSGPIVELPIHDNQHVNSGALLFVVDPRPYKSALDKAEANLILTNLQIKALEDAIRAANARQLQLQADTAYDQQYLQRIEPLWWFARFEAT
jgi:multidrug resistance efflux pump